MGLGSLSAHSHHHKCTGPAGHYMQIWHETRLFVLQVELEHLTEEEELTSDEVLMRRMDAGLYTLQQCGLIIGNLWIVGDQGVKQRLLMLLHQQVCSASCFALCYAVMSVLCHAVLSCAVLCYAVLVHHILWCCLPLSSRQEGGLDFGSVMNYN